jgi:hypothetical protein
LCLPRQPLFKLRGFVQEHKAVRCEKGGLQKDQGKGR